MRSHLTTSILGIVLLGAIFSACSQSDKQKGVTTDIALYFLDTRDPESQKSCGITKGTARIANNITMENAPVVALRLLLGGVNEEERSHGLTDAFQSSAAVPAGTDNLITYYQGVVIQDGIATLQFSEEALAYLNGPACLQEAVKSPIERTMKSFDRIDVVQYAIDGEVWEEWDA